LKFHVAPGDVVDKDQPLATNTSLLGREQSVMTAPFNGVVLGMTTIPAVSPGEAVCYIGQVAEEPAQLQRMRGQFGGDRQHKRVRDDLAKSVLVVDSSEEL
jgi:hypothetical protein